ncbi:E3 ubiquitin-protein ligase BRE1-like 1 [Linum perenne]
MESTGEPDRKRRHFSSLSPTAVMAKKQPLSHFSDDKKLDTAVLQFQNQKLLQKLEAQKVEYSTLESKFSQFKERQQPYDSTLNAIDKSCKLLVNDLEACSKQSRQSSSWNSYQKALKEEIAAVPEDAFLSRLMETGATENSSAINVQEHMDESRETGSGNVEVVQLETERDAVTIKMKNILKNIVIAINDLWHVKDELHARVLKELPNDGTCRQKSCAELVLEVKNLRSTLSDLHIRHRSLSRDLQGRRDTDIKNKAQLKRMKGELETSVSELRSTNCKLATLKAERDATKGTFFPVLNLRSKHGGEKSKEKQKGLHEMESALKELSEQASSRLVALKALHNERIKMLEQLSDLQNSLKNIKCISSSQTFLLARDQLENSKAQVSRYQGIFEKLQVEKDNLLWREKELNIKNDLLDVYRRSSAVMSSRLSELESEIKKHINEQHMIKVKLEEASKEPGRKEVVTEFKVLVSSFADDMSAMQRQLSSYKEAASDIHSLRADVQCLSEVLDRKAKQCTSLSLMSMNQGSEMEKLQSLVKDLKESGAELKTFSDMYRRESTDSRDVMEVRDSEYQAWAQVQSLKLSLDEQNLELRVKTANEAEAISQQKLAAAEAEIADSRERLEASKRKILNLSDALKSKSEENEAYLSEIETIGQAYDDMQTQNQQLLQQVTERDDYNIKLVLEGVRARQLHESLFTDKLFLQREIQQAKVSLDFFKVKTAKIEDQVVITKCYHLFCNPCVQRIMETRQRKCPVCAASFGQNDVKPVYI